MASSSASFWRSVSILLTVLVISQWILFTILLDSQHPTDLTTEAQTNEQPQPPRQPPSLPHPQLLQRITETKATAITIAHTQQEEPPQDKHYDGVAITLMLRAPKWFHRRYTVMLHNILANIPETWVVQVFVNVDWLQHDVLPLHPGLQQMMMQDATNSSNKNSNNSIKNRVIWTPIPKSMTRQKPKDIMKSTWLWDRVVSEDVLVFGGNGALCANANVRLDAFTPYDYVGTPWTQHGGRGGDGSTHSFRHKSIMLEILQDHPPTPKDDDSPDYHYFLKHLLQMQDGTNSNKYKVADRNTTLRFGGASTGGDGIATATSTPLLLSGTQAKLNWTARETLLFVCPELKMIFPSLHEPSCFGAHPNGTKCKETICALREGLLSSGC
jgi:hypothetical protein